MEKEKEETINGSRKDDSHSKIPQLHSDVEDDDEKKYPYPKSVLFIISTEFCERFSYYGMKST